MRASDLRLAVKSPVVARLLVVDRGSPTTAKRSKKVKRSKRAETKPMTYRQAMIAKHGSYHAALAVEYRNEGSSPLFMSWGWR